MKQTIRTGFAALLLLLAMSCKKENSSIQTLSINGNSSAQKVITDDKVLARYTVKIGSQVWMATNLNVARYRNGDKIPQVKNSSEWASLTTGAWCWYNNDPANGAVYGKLYNWYAVADPRGLAPLGWHVPSNTEWITLTTFLGGDLVAGGKMKEAGTAHWSSLNTDATNSSGFTGLPGGVCSVGGSFGLINNYGYWWSSTKYTSRIAWYLHLYYDDGKIHGFNAFKVNGFSVRCIKD